MAFDKEKVNKALKQTKNFFEALSQHFKKDQMFKWIKYKRMKYLDTFR